MGKSELELVLDVLSKAIVRETVSFNYYFKAGKDETLPDGVRGLLAQLAEEERTHRKLLLREYTDIQKTWSGSDSDVDENSSISYPVPEIPNYLHLPRSDKLDLQAVSFPARLVGGDNVIARVIRDRQKNDIGIFVTLYDVMGHGIQTTKANSMAASALGEYLDGTVSAEADKEIHFPARAVNHLNSEFSLQFDGKGVFLTLFSAYIDIEAGIIQYTTAGHEPPMLLRSDGHVDSLLNTQLVIGIDSGRKYIEHSITFEKGDTLCFFSDGILEAKNPQDEFYGRNRLSGILTEGRGKNPKEMILSILADLREFAEGEPLKDELTLVVVSCCS